MSKGKEVGLLDYVYDATVLYSKATNPDSSLADVAKVARVQPIAMISKDLLTYPNLWDIQQGVLNIYAAYYLQAFSIMEVELKDVRLLSVLDRLNPDRDLKNALVAYESFKPDLYSQMCHRDEELYVRNVKQFHCLEGLGLGSKRLSVAVEALAVHATEARVSDDKSKDLVNEDEEVRRNSAKVSKASDVISQANDTVGKVIEVSFTTKDNEELKVPVILELDVFEVESDILVDIMASNTDEISMDSRFKDWMAGRITFWSEFVFASDIIEKQKRNLIRDSSKAYASLLARVNKSRFLGALTKGSSLNTISGIMIVSEEDEDGIRAQLGGDLENELTRKKVFDNSSVMIIVVVDRDADMITVYVRNSSSKSRLPLQAFKKGKDSKDSDIINEIFKSISSNSPISF